MNAPIPPRRKRFKIHLSTAIVMGVVLGLFFVANLLPVSKFENNPYGIGWPFDALLFYSDLHLKTWAGVYRCNKVECNYSMLALNVLIQTMILVVTYYFCEWQVRRRAARKGIR